MRILNPINFVASTGADRWIGSGLKDAFEDLGHEVFWLTTADDIGTRIAEVKPDIIFFGLDRLKRSDVPVLQAFRNQGGKVVIAVSSIFDVNAEYFKIIKEHDVADMYRGETEPEWMKDFEMASGRKFICTPNGAHQRLHFPTQSVKKYECDIIFLGANLPLKKELFERMLFPLQKKYTVKLFGPGWTAKDKTLRAMAYSLRRVGLVGLNNWISEMRITVPPEEENQMYSSAKIAINLHEQRNGIMKNHVILNERTFKSAACGGFGICDFVPPEMALRRYFTADEMVYAKDEKDWFDKIDYYLKHDAEREEIKKKGTARALRDHMYTNRVKDILAHLYPSSWV